MLHPPIHPLIVIPQYPPLFHPPHQAVDGAFLQYALGVLRREGASVHILFSFEYVILASSVLSIGVKYLLFIVDSVAEGRWEGKVGGGFGRGV